MLLCPPIPKLRRFDAGLNPAGFLMAAPAPKPELGAAYMQMATGSVPRPPSLPQSNPLASARLLALKQAEAQLEQQEASIHQEVLQLRREEQLAEQAPMPFAATPPVQAWPAVPQAAPMAMPQAWPQVAQAAPMAMSQQPQAAPSGAWPWAAPVQGYAPYMPGFQMGAWR
ncbi:hypothetical protein AK812_SmicGene4193 [Symbiodinium microadriaticum]|uniref:Uncharacterized protein n=1 Tax=Symbiodinium microadriaticum TaxID=2951 RepID=A0A1Q9EX61_SYMMI|nr:hypothetical protein AK812_SmicGene4193 [Symbiodinium microadriaticum]